MRGVLVALDLETTGLDPANAQIIEIGAVKFRADDAAHPMLETYSTFVDPGIAIPPKITSITGITQDNMLGAPKLRDALPQFEQFVGDAIIVGHNVDFDLRFLQKQGLFKDNVSVDTYELASVLLPTTPRYNLNALMQELQLEPEGDYHRALVDAQATARVYIALWHKLNDLPLELVREIATAAQALPWKGTPVFADALAAKLAAPQNKSASNKPTQSPITVKPSSRRERPGGSARLIDLDKLADDLQASVPQQVEMLRAVGSAFNDNQHLLVEAPVGIDRSPAYLLPAATWALENKQPVVVSVNSQRFEQRLLQHEIPGVEGMADVKIDGKLLKGRSSYLCPRRLETLRRRLPTSVDELRVFAKVQVWLNSTHNGDSSELSLRGSAEHSAWIKFTAEDETCTLDRCERQMQGACAFYQACHAAQDADIVVVSHALLLADAAQPAESQVLPTYERAIIDEAHTLEEEATRALETHFDATSIKRQLADLGTLKTGLLADILNSTRPVLPDATFQKVNTFVKNVTAAVSKMQHHIDTLFADVHGFLEATNSLHASDYLLQIRLTHDLRHKAAFGQVKESWGVLSQFLEAITEAITHLAAQLDSLSQRYEIPYAEDLLESTKAASRHLNTLYSQLNAFIVQPDENMVYWVEISADSEYRSLNSAPLNVGKWVQKHLLATKKTVVLTSATLRASGSFEFVRQRLDTENVPELALTYPVDYEKSTLIYLPTDMPEPQERNRYQQFVERGIIELAAATEGRMLVLFTGFTQLRQAAQNIAPRLALGNISVFDQSDGTSRQGLLDGFKNTERAVLLGTRSLWEDADLSGSDLVALVIVRLPFAVPSDPIYAARGETYENSFNQYTVPDAILRFRQGFDSLGRVHQGRGIVAILDKRMTSKEYGQSFLESLPAATVKRALLADIGATAKEWLGEAAISD